VNSFRHALRYLLLCVLIPTGQAGAQPSNEEPQETDPFPTAMQPYEEYGKRLKSASTVGPLTSEMFGDQVSLYNGSVEFVAVDIDLPGTGAYPVQLRRRLKVEERKHIAVLDGFGEWEIDVPYLHGTFANAHRWEAESGDVSQRCSVVGQPRMPAIGTFEPNEIWHGNFLHIPGRGDEEMLDNVPSKAPDVIHPGVKYPWITKSYTIFRCLDHTANGYPGQGFVARTQDGLTYTFDHGIHKDTTTLRKSYTQTQMNRKKVWLMATRVEDRFGNWVQYHYDGDRLARISAKDGRSITLCHDGADRVVKAFVNDQPGQTCTGGPVPRRTWQYFYDPAANFFVDGTLDRVVLPDTQSVWRYSYSGELVSSRPTDAIEAPMPARPVPTCDVPWQMSSGNYTMTMTHPSGATASFDFGLARHFRSVSLSLDANCRDETAFGVDEGRYETLRVPNYTDTWTLFSKTVTGIGLPTMVWGYDYGDVDPIPSCGNDCENDKIVTVQQPDGTRKQEIFGVRWGVNEGRLLGQKTLEATGPAIEYSTIEYMADADVPAQPFDDEYGASMLHDFDPVANRIRPIIRQTVHRDGVDFTSTNSMFDALARAGRTLQAGTPGASRTQDVLFHDNLSLWLLGQQRRTSINSIVASETTFDAALARVQTQSSFGTLDASYTYHADGNVASITDANQHVTQTNDWHRGVPRQVILPDTTIQSSTVNEFGWITSVTDALLATTHYTYDDMGRTTRVTYPGVANEPGAGAWHDTTSSFAPSTPAYGLDAGHWKQVVSSGPAANPLARTTTHFDAFWRPLVVVTEDTSDASTRSVVVKRYDTQGREVFSSYPLEDIDTIDFPLEPVLCNDNTTIQGPIGDGEVATGVRTVYDALDRVRCSEQDSELGVLMTTTEYQPGLRVRVTNPRGHATTTTYRAYAAPAYDTPILIAEPDQKNTAIVRDVFGKPLTLTRSGPSG
jgi:YD repeat-containing protein